MQGKNTPSPAPYWLVAPSRDGGQARGGGIEFITEDVAILVDSVWRCALPHPRV